MTWVGGDTRHLIASGEGPVAASTDGGATWTPFSVPDGASIVEASPTDANTLFAAGLNGTAATVWITTDGGQIWRRP